MNANETTKDIGLPTGQPPRPPHFAASEYRSSESRTVADYFIRFDWALELGTIPINQHAKYARVHMGGELNNALKFLVNPTSGRVRIRVRNRTRVRGHAQYSDGSKDHYVNCINGTGKFITTRITAAI